MTGILFNFWLRRFSLVFAIAGVALALLERLMHGDNPSYFSAIGWAAAAGFVAASVATYWARKHGCEIPRQSP
jgi:drug/metabolite transporter (DMT)-like permease